MRSCQASEKNNADDQIIDYLIRQIFVVGEQFRLALEERAKINLMEYVTYIIEYYVGMDRVQEGYDYALRMDKGQGNTIENRLRLAVVLGWFRQYEKALAVLDDLEKIEPGNIELIRETASLARAAGKLEVAEKALEKLVALEPDNEAHQKNLVRFICRPVTWKGCGPVSQTCEKFDNWIKYAHDMLRAALFSSDRQLMAEVVSKLLMLPFQIRNICAPRLMCFLLLIVHWKHIRYLKASPRGLQLSI